MKKFLFFCFFCFLFSVEQKNIVVFGDKTVLSSDFFYSFGKNSWETLSEDKKEREFDSFIKKELVYWDALSLGLPYVPEIYMKLEERKKHLLVNAYFERFVALPLVDSLSVLFLKQNIHRELLTHHILFGYNGSALSGSFSVNKKASLALASSVYDSLVVALDAVVGLENKRNVFSSFAAAFSNDPSVKQNDGLLGWVSLGRAVPSFQEAVFKTSKGFVSPPVLTPYGYHLVFIEEERFSDFAYYDKEVMLDFCHKLGIGSVSFDALQAASAQHDSLLLDGGGFVLNVPFVRGLILDLNNYLAASSLRGGKKIYLDFLRGYKKGEVLFVFDQKVFGVGWLVERLKKTPSTRVSSFSSIEDVFGLVSNYVVQDFVFTLALNRGVEVFPVVEKEILKNYKNILLREYVDKKINSIPPPDSSLVKKEYKKGLRDSSLFSEEGVLVLEMKTKRESFADSLALMLKEGVDFSVLVDSFFDNSFKKQKTIKKNTKGLLGEAAFSLPVGGVSGLIKNTDKTFSFLQNKGRLPKEPLLFQNVYKRLEQKIKKELQDSVKFFLLSGLKSKFNFSFDFKEL